MTLRPTIAAFGMLAGQLAVGGMPLKRLDRVARRHSSPMTACCALPLESNYSGRRLPTRIDLSYAVKANPMPAVVQHLATLVDSFDVASALEMRTALDTSMRADKISFAGPGKTEAEITQAVASGVTIEMESPTEAARILNAGDRLGVRPRVAIRVNPDFEIKGSGYAHGRRTAAIWRGCGKSTVPAGRPSGRRCRIPRIPCIRRVTKLEGGHPL